MHTSGSPLDCFRYRRILLLVVIVFLSLVFYKLIFGDVVVPVKPAVRNQGQHFTPNINGSAGNNLFREKKEEAHLYHPSNNKLDRYDTNSDYAHPDNNGKLSDQTTCKREFKNNHFAVLELLPGRTGTIVFQLFCLLTLSAKYCYTPILRPNVKHLDQIFDVKNIQRAKHENITNFIEVSNNFTHRRFNVKFMYPDLNYNWTLKNRCESYKYFSSYELFIRSSLTIKKTFTDEAHSFMEKFINLTTVCVHVRRTDKIHGTRTLNWYENYILRAMNYLKHRHNVGLEYIFVSDDIQWCKLHFSGHNIHFSPGKSPGFDFALMTMCNHTILTIGTFGWMGAWFGRSQTVIYNTKYLMNIEYNHGDLFLPSWIGLR